MPSVLCPLPSAGPRAAGEIEASLPTLSHGQALCPGAASAVQTLSQAVQPWANARPLCAGLPPAPSSQAAVVVQGAQTPTLLNQPDTEKRERLLKKKQSVRRVGNSSGPRMTHKAERRVCWRPSEVVTGTLIHPPPPWTAGRDLAQRLFPPLDSEILRTAAVLSFGALSPRTVPNDPVPSPYEGSPSQQDCISDSPGDHGQATGRLGAPGAP